MRNPDRFERLGIRQTVKLRWMDQTLRAVLAGKDESAIRQELTMMLADDETKCGARGAWQYSKNIALLAAWFAPKDDLGVFVGQLIQLARQLDHAEWVALHWAVLAGSYPFFFAVSSVVGRLLTMQETVAKAQVQRRIEETYGTPGMLERTPSGRAALSRGRVGMCRQPPVFDQHGRDGARPSRVWQRFRNYLP